METLRAADKRQRYERTTWLFALAFSLLVSHEMDAMIRNEWEFFPGLSTLASEAAADVFNLLHVPLIALLIWLLVSGSVRARRSTMVGIEMFLVAHALVHAALRGSERYEFQAPVETITVYGAAVVSLVHLGVLWMSVDRPRSSGAPADAVSDGPTGLRRAD
jgi:hypothetical protein